MHIRIKLPILWTLVTHCRGYIDIISFESTVRTAECDCPVPTTSKDIRACKEVSPKECIWKLKAQASNIIRFPNACEGDRWSIDVRVFTEQSWWRHIGDPITFDGVLSVVLASAVDNLCPIRVELSNTQCGVTDAIVSDTPLYHILPHSRVLNLPFTIIESPKPYALLTPVEPVSDLNSNRTLGCIPLPPTIFVEMTLTMTGEVYNDDTEP